MKIQVLIFALLAISGAFAGNTKVDVVVKIFQGFVNGLGQEINLSDVQPCIQNSDAIFADFQLAVQDFSKNNAGSAWKGIQDVVNGLQLLPSVIQTCKGAVQEAQVIAKAISAFGSPVAFFFDVTKHIFVNHKEITDDINQAIKSWNSQDWTNYGFYLGEAVGLAIFGNPSIHAVTPQDLPLIFEGILEGIGAQTGYPEIANCIDLSNEIAQNITTASAEIAQRQYQTILSGIILISQTLQVLPEAIHLCQGAEQDIELLYKALQAYQNPKSFIFNAGKNLLINGVDIYSELANASANYQAGNWFYYGYDLGLALSNIVFGQQSQILQAGSTAENVLAFANGFLVGIGDGQNWPEIKNCIDTSQQVAVLLQQAYNNFTKETPSSVLAGIVALGQAAQIIPDAARNCNATLKDLQAIIAAVKAFQNPSSFFYHVGVSLLLNRREIYHEITAAVQQYKSKNWYGFGYYCGEAFSTLVLGDAAMLEPEFANFLNQRVGWEAGIPEIFANKTLDEISNTYFGADIELSDEDRIEFDYTNMVEDLPTAFDARKQWPGCVHPIRDQGHCGSCWAFAASETLSDRFCIASNGVTDVVLSPQWMVSCDMLAFGCNGGNLAQSWQFLENTGITADDCTPYQSYNGTSPKCNTIKTCADGSELKKYYAKKGSSVTMKNPTSIQTNLQKFGPIDTGMQVYEDFMYYTGGIYTHTSGKLLGGHAIKIVGWGQENGTNYWIVANSWSASWGENGFFRIAFGQCGIDSGAVSGEAKI